MGGTQMQQAHRSLHIVNYHFAGIVRRRLASRARRVRSKMGSGGTVEERKTIQPVFLMDSIYRWVIFFQLQKEAENDICEEHLS
jgi:hypothetical protein